MKSYGTIYLITNTVNKKQYIGQTTLDLRKRWLCHMQSAKHGTKNTPFCNAIKKYGVENFIIEPVGGECLNKEALDSAEIKAIADYKTLSPYGYNIKTGGSFGRHSLETKQKMSNSHKGKKRSPEHCRALSERMKGISPSKITRDKISKKLKGRKLPKEVCEKMGKSRLGKKHTEKSKRLMSKNRSGTPMTEAAKEKLSIINTGKKHSAKTLEKMRVSQIRAWKKRKNAAKI